MDFFSLIQSLSTATLPQTLPGETAVPAAGVPAAGVPAAGAPAAGAPAAGAPAAGTFAVDLPPRVQAESPFATLLGSMTDEPMDEAEFFIQQVPESIVTEPFSDAHIVEPISDETLPQAPVGPPVTSGDLVDLLPYPTDLSGKVLPYRQPHVDESSIQLPGKAGTPESVTAGSFRVIGMSEPEGDGYYLTYERRQDGAAKFVDKEGIARRYHEISREPVSIIAKNQPVRTDELPGEFVKESARILPLNATRRFDSEVEVPGQKNVVDAPGRKHVVLIQANEALRHSSDPGDKTKKGETSALPQPGTMLYGTDGTQPLPRVTPMMLSPVQSQVLGSVNQLPDQINIMLSRGAANATLHIELADLGRVDIKVRMDSDLAHINFTVHHSAREAIENYLPRLRTLLEASGLWLGDVDVSSSSQDDTHRQFTKSADRYAEKLRVNEDGSQETQTKITVRARSRQIIDAFA